MLGSSPQALYFPIDLQSNDLMSVEEAKFPQVVDGTIEVIADFMRRGVVDQPSVTREVHQVRGFNGDVFTKSFRHRWDGKRDALSVLSAYLGALQDCRQEAAATHFAVEKSPSNELIYDQLAGSGPAPKLIHIIRSLRDVYASWKAKFLGQYLHFVHTSLNLSRHIIETWRRALLCEERNLLRYGPENYLVVEFADVANMRPEFIARLCEFIFPAAPSRQALLWQHLDGLVRGGLLRNQFLTLQSNSSFDAHRSGVSSSLPAGILFVPSSTHYAGFPGTGEQGAPEASLGL